VSFQLLLRPAAKADLREAFGWYETQQTGLGDEFLQAVERKLTHIESNPLQFPAVRNVTRRAIVARFPYSIFYIPQNELISVLAVMHHARAPLQWQRRI
jgi:plasmid stabilization system protein ParE